MKAVFLVLGFIATLGCAQSETVLLKGPAGQPGAPGEVGAPGHSAVSLSRAASELECEVSGTAVDVYLDLDDSLSVTEGDTLQSGLVACNGANGLDGADGANGVDGADGSDGQDGADGADGEDGTNATAVMTAYTIGSSCQVIHSGWSAKKHDSDSVKVYSNESCSGSSETLDDDNDDMFVISNSVVLLYQNLVIRKLVFN